jgi:hypothetical protein
MFGFGEDHFLESVAAVATAGFVTLSHFISSCAILPA